MTSIDDKKYYFAVKMHTEEVPEVCDAGVYEHTLRSRRGTDEGRRLNAK